MIDRLPEINILEDFGILSRKDNNNPQVNKVGISEEKRRRRYMPRRQQINKR